MRSISVQFLIGVSFLVWVVASTQGQENYETEWTYKATLTLNTSSSGADVSGTVQNFPILLRLDNSNFDFSNAKANGEDLRFAKDGDAISYEIELWNASEEEAVVWVLLDEVLGNDASQSITMYWGNSSASSRSSGSDVFSTNNHFSSVWHFNEDPNGDSSMVIKDRTLNQQHLTPYGGMTSEDNVVAVVGKGIDLDGSDDYLDVGIVNMDFTGGMTICTWVNYDGFNSWSRLLDFGRGAADKNIIFAHRGTTNELALYYYSDTVYHNFYISNLLVSESWLYVCGVYDSDNNMIRMYHQGAEVGVDSIGYSPSTVGRTSSYVGKSNWNHDGYLNAQLDEMRVSTATRSADWIKLSFASQKRDANWLTVGSPQSLNIHEGIENGDRQNTFVHNGFSQLLIPAGVNRIMLYNTQGEQVVMIRTSGKQVVSLPPSLSYGLLYVKYYQ